VVPTDLCLVEEEKSIFPVEPPTEAMTIDILIIDIPLEYG
jgi:hypothetical protein